MDSSTTLIATLRTLREVDIALALSNLSAYYVACDRWHDARIHAREALCVARVTRQYVDVAWMLQHLAAVAALSPAPDHEARCTNPEVAALLLGYVDRYSARIGASRGSAERQEYDRTLGALRDALDGRDLAALIASGGGMTLNEAIDQAFSI
jgi:hypothetical protein